MCEMKEALSLLRALALFYHKLFYFRMYSQVRPILTDYGTLREEDRPRRECIRVAYNNPVYEEIIERIPERWIPAMVLTLTLYGKLSWKARTNWPKNASKEVKTTWTIISNNRLIFSLATAGVCEMKFNRTTFLLQMCDAQATQCSSTKRRKEVQSDLGSGSEVYSSWRFRTQTWRCWMSFAHFT